MRERIALVKICSINAEKISLLLVLVTGSNK